MLILTVISSTMLLAGTILGQKYERVQSVLFLLAGAVSAVNIAINFRKLLPKKNTQE